MIEIVVYGMPAPQGSKRFLGLKSGKGILVESSKAVKPWRQAVAYAAREKLTSLGLESGLHGPVIAEMIFTLHKPWSAPKRKRIWPDRRPDLSKLIRATEDALTDAGAWDDDARVVRLVAEKIYSGECAGSLNTPGARIRIWPVEECA